MRFMESGMVGVSTESVKGPGPKILLTAQQGEGLRSELELIGSHDGDGLHCGSLQYIHIRTAFDLPMQLL